MRPKPYAFEAYPLTTLARCLADEVINAGEQDYIVLDTVAAGRELCGGV